MKVFLAAAHGARDPGAVVAGTTEREESIKIVDQAIELLKPVLTARVELIKVPHNLDLGDEVRFINDNSVESPADICVEVNMNSNVGQPGTGIETYYGEQNLAVKLHEVLVRETGLRDRGVKYGMHLYFNHATNPPSALVELGFINNPHDLVLVRQKGAVALASSLAQYLSLRQPAAVQPLPQPGVDYKILYETLKESVREVLEAAKNIVKKLT